MEEETLNTFLSTRNDIFIWGNVILFITCLGILFYDQVNYEIMNRPERSAAVDYMRNVAFMIVFLQVVVVLSMLGVQIQRKPQNLIWWILYGLFVLCMIYWFVYYIYYESGFSPEKTAPREMVWTQTGAMIYVTIITIVSFIWLFRGKFGRTTKK